MKDHEVFEKLKEGDRTAMAWVYRTYRDEFVSYFIKNKKIQGQEAKDLAVDALVALTRLAECNKERALTARLSTLWIGIGKNQYYSQLRKKKKEAVIDSDDFDNLVKQMIDAGYVSLEKKEVPVSPLKTWKDFLAFVKNAKGWEDRIETADFEEVLPVLEPIVEPLVKGMGEPCQTILTQYYWENKKDREVSDIINATADLKNMTPSAVKMKRRHCIDALRKLIFNLKK